MVKFICESCSYKKDFKEFVPAKCPYCGEEHTLGEEKSAEQLLEEIEKE
jgi:predicted RNA-binding Zn-ribbon protein involved in translation (DUF1610 family)